MEEIVSSVSAPIEYQPGMDIRSLIEASPEGEIYIRNLPLSAITQPRCLPVDRRQRGDLGRLKAQIRAAFGETGTHNGLRDAIWVILLPDGTLQISNGFHRYAIIEELSAELEDIFSQCIYARIKIGGKRKLLEERLIGAGNHTAVTPARFIKFMTDDDSWPYSIPFATVLPFIDTGDEAIQQSGYVVDELRDAVVLVRFAVNILNLQPQDVAVYAMIASNVSPTLYDIIRLRPDPGTGEIPLTLARGLASDENTMHNFPLQETIVQLMLEGNLSVGDALDLIDTLIFISPDLYPRIRINPSIQKGEISLALVEAFAGNPATLYDIELQERVVNEAVAGRLSDEDAIALIDTLAAEEPLVTVPEEPPATADTRHDPTPRVTTIVVTNPMTSEAPQTLPRPSSPLTREPRSVTQAPIAPTRAETHFSTAQALYEAAVRNARLMTENRRITAEAAILKFSIGHEFADNENRQLFVRTLSQIPQIIVLFLMQQGLQKTMEEIQRETTRLCQITYEVWQESPAQAASQILALVNEIQRQRIEILEAQLRVRVQSPSGIDSSTSARTLVLENLLSMQNTLAETIELMQSETARIKRQNGQRASNGSRKLRQQVGILIDLVYTLINDLELDSSVIASILADIDPHGALASFFDFDLEVHEAAYINGELEDNDDDM